MLPRIAALIMLLSGVHSDANAAMLYAITDDTDRLVVIDTVTLALDDIGALGVDVELGGLAFDPSTSTLYMVGGSNRNLYEVDTVSGAATLIGPTEADPIYGLAFDGQANVLYGMGSGGTQYTIDTATGSANDYDFLNDAGGGQAYDGSRDLLVSTGHLTAPMSLYDTSRPPETATRRTLATHLTALGQGSGLAYDPVSDSIWGVSRVGTLFSYDPNDSYSETLHATGLGQLSALALVPIPEPSTALLLAASLAGLAARRRHQAPGQRSRTTPPCARR